MNPEETKAELAAQFLQATGIQLTDEQLEKCCKAMYAIGCSVSQMVDALARVVLREREVFTLSNAATAIDALARASNSATTTIEQAKRVINALCENSQPKQHARIKFYDHFYKTRR